MLKNGGVGHQEPQKESPIMRLPLSTRIAVRFPMHPEWSRDWRVADSPSLLAGYRGSRDSAWRLLPALPRPHAPPPRREGRAETLPRPLPKLPSDNPPRNRRRQGVSIDCLCSLPLSYLPLLIIQPKLFGLLDVSVLRCSLKTTRRHVASGISRLRPGHA